MTAMHEHTLDKYEYISISSQAMNAWSNKIYTFTDNSIINKKSKSINKSNNDNK